MRTPSEHQRKIATKKPADGGALGCDNAHWTLSLWAVLVSPQATGPRHDSPRPQNTRSGRDSNPRDPSGPAPLAGVCLRPLGHHSACPYIGQVQGKQGLFGLHQESSLSDCFHEFSRSFPRTVRPIRANGFAPAFQACDAPRHGGSRGRAAAQRPVRTLRIRQDDARWRPAARPNRGVEAAFHAAAARPVLEPLPGQARPARIQSECGGGDCFGAARDLPKKTTVRNRLSRLDREHRGMRLMSSIFSGATSR